VDLLAANARGQPFMSESCAAMRPERSVITSTPRTCPVAPRVAPAGPATNHARTFDALQEVLPDVTRVTLPGVGHTAPDNAGQPQLVADALIRFFTSCHHQVATCRLT
jgi:hypothetical protein